jgi:MazG family protein
MLPASRRGDKRPRGLFASQEVDVDGLHRLRDTIARLRGDGGCPWDQAQTEHSMRLYLLEEAYEVIDAIDRASDADTRRELGDLLFVAGLIARIAEERGAFDLEAAANAASDKMIARHPEVFGPESTILAPSGTMRAWEGRKQRERPSASLLDGVPGALPALVRAHRIGEKASGVGFDWPDIAGLRDKLSEEIAEFDAAARIGDRDAMEDELGDILFTLANLGRHLRLPGEDALRRATAKFETRFRAMEASATAAGQRLADLDATALDALWNAAKALEA